MVTVSAALSYVVIILFTKAMGLCLTILIPNHSLIHVLILTLIEI